MKIYQVEFAPIYPVGGCCIIAAENIKQAVDIAHATIKHTNNIKVSEVDISKPCVVVYESGDY